MPIFQYHCLDCNHEFEKIVIPGQAKWPEPDQCPECRSQVIEKVLTAPASIRMDGKTALRSLPDPTPPLRALQEKGPREGCEGGYKDLPEMGKLERRKTKDGQWEWVEKKKQVYDMGKK
jgi:putative FmdB family regulatory protein